MSSWFKIRIIALSAFSIGVLWFLIWLVRELVSVFLNK